MQNISLKEVAPFLLTTGNNGYVLLEDNTLPHGMKFGALPATALPSAIDAAKIANGTFTNTQFQQLPKYIGTVAGTDTYTSSQNLAAYVTGQIYYGVFTNANTGACTLNISGLGAKSIKKGAADPSGGDIPAGRVTMLMYDGTNLQLI